MIGLLIACAFWACILVAVIKMFTDDDVMFSTVFITSLIATYVGGLLLYFATRPMESATLIFATTIFITLLTTVVVQIVCSTDVKTVVKITLTFTAIRGAVALAASYFLAG